MKKVELIERNWWPAFWVGLILVPPLFLLFLIFLYGVDVPLWDSWDFIPVIDKFYAGKLTFRDLYSQHNEHRLFFPRLIMLWMAYASGWRASWEWMFTYFSAVAIFFVLLAQTRKTLKTIFGSTQYWLPLAFVLSLYVFSLAQVENWVWGFQLQIMLCVLAVVTGFYLLCRPVYRWWAWFGGVACGVVASYSFTNGLIFWPVGLLLLMFRGYEAHRTRLISSLCWLMVSVVVWVAYFHGYVKPAHHPSMLFVFQSPHLYIGYVLGFLGQPIALIHPVVCAISGVVALLLLGSGLIILLRDKGVPYTSLLFYCALALFAIITAAIVGVGRAGFGLAQALSSRYVTFSTLLWVANITLFYIIILLGIQRLKNLLNEGTLTWPRLTSIGGTVTAGIVVIAVLVTNVVASDGRSIEGFQAQYYKLTAARAALLAMNNDNQLRRLHPNPNTIKNYSEVLRRYHLSVFR